MNRTKIADMVLYMVSVEEAEKPETRARALEIADKIMSEIPKITAGDLIEMYAAVRAGVLNFQTGAAEINNQIRG